jgi:hypothetical protein
MLANKTGNMIAVILFGMIAVLFQSHAGTVITTNLPANTAIVNIDGRADGSASFDGGQTHWFQPFNTGGTLLQYTVQPGTYSFWPINPADAAARFPALTGAQTNQIYTAWTYNSPWILDYLVFDSSAATNASVPQLFDGAQDIGYANAIAAYTNAFLRGTYNQLHTAGRLGTNIATTYTFTNTTTLIFVVPDYALGDNNGGVSVLVFPSPRLTIGLNGNSVSVQWPTNNSIGFTLAQTTNLASGVWTDVGQSPGTLNANYIVTLPLDASPNHFFRLHNP